MAGKRKLECAAEANAVHRRGEGLAAGLEPTVEQRQPARFLEEELHRLICALLGRKLAVSRAQALKHGEVRAAGEGFLARGDDAAFDRVVARDHVDDARQLVHHFCRDDIHRPARYVPGCGGDAVGVDLEAEIREAHLHVSAIFVHLVVGGKMTATVPGESADRPVKDTSSVRRRLDPLDDRRRAHAGSDA